jgi:hypothetical protein
MIRIYPLLGNGCFLWVGLETLLSSPVVNQKSVIERDPCGGVVEYLHRDPASRRRRRKEKSRI